MHQSSGEPNPTEAEARVEPSNSEELDQADSRHVLNEEKTDSEEGSTVAKDAPQSEDWWAAPQPGTTDWAKPAATAPATEVEPIDLLARNGEIIFVTNRDSVLYCAETPAVLANVDAVIVDRARSQQSETGIPFFLTLARQESIARQPAMELMEHYGQKLFSQLWTAPRVWVMFEKNAELLNDAADVSGEANVDDWTLETLRFVQNLDLHVTFEPTSIPAYTKDGYERVQKLNLTSDEAQFASQFNGVRSVQQIAKNLRLDLKSAQLTLFRFLALEIIECWPASTAAKPERKNVFQRFARLIGRGR